MLKSVSLAAALLLVCAVRHYGWLAVEPASMGIVSKGLGSVAALCLIAVIAWQQRSRIVLAVLGWYAFEELQTAVCSFLYWNKPWPVEVGQSICSARVGFDIGAIGILVVGTIAYCIAKRDMK